MIPTQTMTAFPVFSDNGTKLQPDEAKYSAGFVEADVLPYQWVNWFLNTASDAITKINSGVQSVEVELNNILTEAGKTPSALTTTQVLDSIVSIITTKITKNLTIKDADETNAGATIAFTSGGNITLKLPATIKATLTGNASSATNSSQFDSKTPAQFRTYMSKVVETVTGSQSIVPVYDGKYYLNAVSTFILTIADGTENGVTIELRNISGVKHTLQGKIGGTTSVQKDLSAGDIVLLEWDGDKWDIVSFNAEWQNGWQDITSDWSLAYSSASSSMLLNKVYYRESTGEIKIIVKINNMSFSSDAAAYFGVKYTGNIDAIIALRSSSSFTITGANVSFGSSYVSGQQTIFIRAFRILTGETTVYATLKNDTPSSQTYTGLATIHITL